MDRVEEVRRLMQAYIEEFPTAEKKVGFMQRFFASPGSLETDKLTDRFFEKIVPILEETEPEEVYGMSKLVIEKSAENCTVRYMGITFTALQRFMLAHADKLTTEQAAELYGMLENGFPHRYRLPVVEEYLKELKSRSAK